MLKKRIHVFEIEDLSFCPRVLRDGITDILQHAINRRRVYYPVVPKLLEALDKTNTTQIIDLCSGGGGPWPSLFPKLTRDRDADINVLLTDKFPNTKAFERTRAVLGDGFKYQTEGISAFDVPPDLHGFRTVFTAFHHFRPEDGREMIADAVRKGEGIAIFEFTARRIIPMLFMLVMAPLGTLISSALVKPFRWSRVLLTYVFPILPLCTLWDGMISCFRTYSPDELQEIVDSLPDNSYHWEIGRIEKPAINPITYLVGYPKV